MGRPPLLEPALRVLRANSISGVGQKATGDGDRGEQPAAGRTMGAVEQAFGLIIRSPTELDLAVLGSETKKELEIAIKQFADTIDQSVASEKDAASGINEALANPDLRKFASQSPEVKAKLGAIAEATKQRLKEVDTHSAAEKKALVQLKEALGKLIPY